ncbi:hypothetical protein TARUN_345 [Trichoderma arundinaceum]|uniref:Polyprenal reductase n=1 Tax=Trichoderma arundinaceum TaxID=490622 RepID=A0A395P0H8_TRIAR|nr:hypothetical protein TARUN_345 [Trichoderma arundinaceum]
MDNISKLLPTLDVGDLSPAELCQAFFIVSAGSIFMLQVFPDDMRRALLDYGARREPRSQATGHKAKTKAEAEAPKEGFLDVLTSYGQLPHSWFIHFYITSVSWSIFWGWQFLSKGSLMRTIAETQHQSAVNTQSPEVELTGTLVAWLLMSSQGIRRLSECIFVMKPGSSPMWFVHWALGLAYYTALGTSVWIQGSGAILRSWESPQPIHFTPQIIIGAAVFGFAGSQQNNCHKYLASLKKYTFPNEGWFRYLICPHYTFECLLYLSLAVVAAPTGSVFNKPVLCSLVFVLANLGATAYGTKVWYAKKFGADKVAGRWTMIPFVF